jgi:hypothetical protein
MARSLDEVLVELGAAYIARAEMMQGKRVAAARLADAESARNYNFSDLVTFDEMQAYIAMLEAERDMIMGLDAPQAFRKNENIAMTYRKGGV